MEGTIGRLLVVGEAPKFGDPMINCSRRILGYEREKGGRLKFQPHAALRHYRQFIMHLLYVPSSTLKLQHMK